MIIALLSARYVTTQNAETFIEICSLFYFYDYFVGKTTTSTLAEYQKYLAMCQCGDDVHDSLLFWKKNMKELPKLFELVIKVPSMPATSAPVERVFSHGSIIMRPHRARLNDTMLPNNVFFLKCNNNSDIDFESSTD
jgi:hAT family C-terminal dimerisation region